MHVSDLFIIRVSKIEMLADGRLNAQLRQAIGVANIFEVKRRQRLHWFGHVMKRDQTEWIKHVMQVGVEGRRPVGRQR